MTRSEPLVRREDEMTALVTVDSNTFSEDVVFKTFYWYGGDYDVRVERDGSDFAVTLVRQDGPISDVALDALRVRVARDLLDFRTRAIVARETQAVRELLVAKAFAPLDGLESPPPGDPSDPVGFDVTDWE